MWNKYQVVAFKERFEGYQSGRTGVVLNALPTKHAVRMVLRIGMNIERRDIPCSYLRVASEPEILEHLSIEFDYNPAQAILFAEENDMTLRFIVFLLSLGKEDHVKDAISSVVDAVCRRTLSRIIAEKFYLLFDSGGTGITYGVLLEAMDKKKSGG